MIRIGIYRFRTTFRRLVKNNNALILPKAHHCFFFTGCNWILLPLKDTPTFLLVTLLDLFESFKANMNVVTKKS